MSCSVEGGAAGSGMPGNRHTGSSGMLPQPNIIRTGTGPLALTGTTTAILMSTVIAGCAELSTCPITRRATTGWPPTVVSTVSATVHVTFGTLSGTRP